MSRINESYIIERVRKLLDLLEERQQQDIAYGLTWDGLLELIDMGIRELENKKKNKLLEAEE